MSSYYKIDHKIDYKIDNKIDNKTEFNILIENLKKICENSSLDQTGKEEILNFLKNSTEEEFNYVKKYLYKYRTTKYDYADKIYATKMRELFESLLDKTIQKDFQDFTQNLMDDKFINRYCLLEAISDFNKELCNSELSSFYIYAYNYRPN